MSKYIFIHVVNTVYCLQEIYSFEYKLGT